MRYITPTIVNTFNATGAVQSVGKPETEKVAGFTPDGIEQLCSPKAYEADE